MLPASGDGTLEIGYAALTSRTVVRTVSAGPADGSPVLLLHGWGSSALLFRQNLPALARAGHRAVAVDLKGHGLSDKPERDRDYTLTAMKDHVMEIMDALALPRCALVGQSMGGRIALEVARLAPSRVDRLVLISPVGIGEFRPRALLRLAGWRALEPLGSRLATRTVVRLALGLVYGGRARPSDELIEQYCEPLQYSEYSRVLQRFVREFSWDPVEAGLLEGIRARILVVLGTRDVVLSVARDHPLLRERPRLRVAWVEGAGHVPNDECPEEVNRVMIDFLRGEA